MFSHNLGHFNRETTGQQRTNLLTWLKDSLIRKYPSGVKIYTVYARYSSDFFILKRH